MDSVNQKQTLLLEDKKRLTIDGIINVESFREDFLELSSNYGRIEVEGSDLKIEELRQENGKIYITGEIYGVFYGDNKPVKRLFGKKQR